MATMANTVMREPIILPAFEGPETRDGVSGLVVISRQRLKGVQGAMGAHLSQAGHQVGVWFESAGQREENLRGVNDRCLGVWFIGNKV